MRNRPPVVRFSWLLAAALQLMLPGAAAWADAQLDAAGARATAHIESHTTSSCARIHPPDCALCHFLTAPLTPRQPATLRLGGPGDPVPHRAEPTAVPRAVDWSHPQSRAPPALS